jgi:hypothetical protein
LGLGHYEAWPRYFSFTIPCHPEIQALLNSAGTAFRWDSG